MPWYTNATKTCKVLNKIAARHKLSELQELDAVLDNAVALILRKQEQHNAANLQQ
jgi:hypothetical protein